MQNAKMDDLEYPHLLKPHMSCHYGEIHGTIVDVHTPAHSEGLIHNNIKQQIEKSRIPLQFSVLYANCFNAKGIHVNVGYCQYKLCFPLSDILYIVV